MVSRLLFFTCACKVYTCSWEKVVVFFYSIYTQQFLFGNFQRLYISVFDDCLGDKKCAKVNPNLIAVCLVCFYLTTITATTKAFCNPNLPPTLSLSLTHTQTHTHTHKHTHTHTHTNTHTNTHTQIHTHTKKGREREFKRKPGFIMPGLVVRKCLWNTLVCLLPTFRQC